MAKKKSQPTIPDADLSGARGDAPPAAEGGEPRRRSCGTMQVHYRMLAESPAYAQALSRIENLAFEFEQGHRTAARGVTRIPVVVHVVWRTNAENISDQQIQSQIDVLNRDFRATNTDVGSTPQVWQGIVGDSRLEFFLATQDPNGNPTNGVTRRQTTVAGFSGNDAVKSAASGGTDAWPSDRYLNVWVCELSGGLLGYAQFPGGPAATDGVVITHSAFGTMGTAAAPFNLGRTATHEIGHWLNLRHIWGDDGSGCGGDDLVADTPNQAGANVGCPTFPHVSCNNDPNGDMFMNYMDYVDDGCMMMFTQGQVARMDAALTGPRASFLNQSLRLAHAMWTHGHSMDIEFPGRLLSTWPAGFYMRVEGKRNTDNWFHFAIPTPVIVDDQRLCVGSVMLRFRTRTSRAYVHAVHIYDGENRIQAYDNLRLSPNQWSFERFEVPAHPNVVWGLGISIGVRFRGSSALDNRMEFSSAGCDFLL